MGFKTSVLQITTGEPTAISAVLGIKLTTPRARLWMTAGSPMSHLTHAGLACLLLHDGGVMLGLKTGPWVSQCPTCWSRAASHCTAGAAWMQPEPASRTGGPRNWRWHFRDGFGSGINNRLERCDRIARASGAGQAAWCRLWASACVRLQQLHMKGSDRDMRTSVPGYHLPPVLLLLPSTMPKWYLSLLEPLQWPSWSTGSEILCVNRNLGRVSAKQCLVLKGYFEPVWNISLTPNSVYL